MEAFTENEDIEISTSIEAEKNYFGIKNLVPEIEASSKGIPLSEQSSEILSEFERNESKVEVIGENNNSLVDYSREFEEKIKNEAQNLFSEVQKINPDVPLENIPLYLLSSPVKRIACTLEGKGIAINTRFFQEKEKDSKFVANTIVHEATHVFIKRLGKQPEFLANGLKDEVMDFLWFEGLAQHMEPYPNETSEMYMEDVEMWPRILTSWFNAESEEEKDTLINTITNMESFKKIMLFKHGKDYENGLKGILERTSQDEALKALIVQEGFGYYIGKYLWEKELEKGYDLKDLVMRGSKDIRNWVE